MFAVPKKIIVGSASPAKIGAAKIAVVDYWGANVSVEGVETDSGVSAMPVGDEETSRGAYNRAKAVITQGADIGLGVEGGLVETPFGLYMTAWAVAVHHTGEVHAARDASFPLPQTWVEALRKGAELRPLMIATGLPYDYKQGVVGFLTMGTLPREHALVNGIRGALAPFANARAYLDPASQEAQAIAQQVAEGQRSNV